MIPLRRYTLLGQLQVTTYLTAQWDQKHGEKLTRLEKVDS